MLNENVWLGKRQSGGSTGKMMDVLKNCYGSASTPPQNNIMVQFAVDPSGMQETRTDSPYSATLTLKQASRCPYSADLARVLATKRATISLTSTPRLVSRMIGLAVVPVKDLFPAVVPLMGRTCPQSWNSL